MSTPLESTDGRMSMSNWQSIETAPKDGTVVLVGRDMGGPWGFVVGYGYHVVHGVTGGVAIKGWISRGFYEPPGELGLASPTHWMPLPQPPEQP